MSRGSDVNADYVRKYMQTTWHAIGTASMLPREKNGVVNPELRVRVHPLLNLSLTNLRQVYGTRNLRVGDLSIVPIHIAAHMQATAYAIGERRTYLFGT